jgi:hypothetical protein
VNRLRIGLLAGICAAGILLLAANRNRRDAAADDETAADPDYGTITGQILLEGEIPKLPPRVEKGNMKVNDPAICTAADVPDDSLVVDPKTKGIAHVFVYLQKVEKVHPKLKDSQVKEVDFDQRACRFVPHALVVRTDQVVRVKSSDNCTHNTKTNPRINDPVNFPLQANDRTGAEVKFKVPERLPFEVQCNVHNWMSARWLIVDHPYAVVSDEQGKFKIAALPAGEHELTIWQERVGYIETKDKARKHKVTVIGGKTIDLGTIKIPVAKFMEQK